MNVVIYARFSSHSQTEQSIEGQLKVCLKALSLIHGHKRESSVKKKRVCLTWNADLSSPS